MNGWTIGRVATHFDLSPSTLRYYENRGFLHPGRTSAGARRYDQDQLRRIAFLRLASSLGIALDMAISVLDEPRPRWKRAVQTEQARVEQRIVMERNALVLLSRTSGCPHHHPGRDCPDLHRALDMLIDQAQIEDLAQEFA